METKWFKNQIQIIVNKLLFSFILKVGKTVNCIGK